VFFEHLFYQQLHDPREHYSIGGLSFAIALKRQLGFENFTVRGKRCTDISRVFKRSCVDIREGSVSRGDLESKPNHSALAPLLT
jgi:hypothetical protein